MTIMMKNPYFRNTWRSSKTLCVRACMCVCANAVAQGPMKSIEIQASAPVQAIAYHCIFCQASKKFHTYSQHTNYLHLSAINFLPETVCDITPAQNMLHMFAACFCGPALMKIHGLRSIDRAST